MTFRRSIEVLVAILASGSFGGALADAAVIRVPADFATVQGAIDAASDGDAILVSPGTYVETIDFSGKNVVVRSTDGPEVTILDANGAGSVVTFRSLESSAAVLEGFTLTRGTGTTVGLSLYGGGVFCTFASPTIRGNVIAGNVAHFGGGVACFIRGSALLEDNLVADNVASAGEESPFGSGGGVFTSEESYPVLRGNRILRNVADYRGGGVASSVDSDPLLEGNTLADNRADLEGGGMACWSTSGPLLFDNVFERNRTELRGGGLFANASSPVVVRCVFRENLCDRNGGGVHLVSGADAWIEASRFVDNEAGLGGGGLHCDLASPVVASSVFLGNVARCEGEACGGGAAFLTTNSHAVLVGNTFHGNVSTMAGGAIHVLVFSNPVIANCILWENPGEGGAELTVLLSDATVIHSIVKGGWPGVSVLDEDPRFVDPPGGDLHLRLGSPAVDAGWNGAPSLPSADFEGDVRIRDGLSGSGAVVDLGADELAPEAAVRFGSVNAAGESLASVLTVNGSAGDESGRGVTVSLLEGVTVEMAAPPAGPDPAPFALYAWEGEPDLLTLTPQPFGLGYTAFPTPIEPRLLPQPVQVWNNLGHRPRLGVPTLPSDPAPSIVIAKRARYGGTFTLQGIVLDQGSTADGPASVTNAVVVRVVD